MKRLPDVLRDWGTTLAILMVLGAMTIWFEVRKTPNERAAEKAKADKREMHDRATETLCGTWVSVVRQGSLTLDCGDGEHDVMDATLDDNTGHHVGTWTATDRRAQIDITDNHVSLHGTFVVVEVAGSASVLARSPVAEQKLADSFLRDQEADQAAYEESMYENAH